MDASTSYGYAPIGLQAKYEEDRIMWANSLSRFEYLVPEGSFDPYIPPYGINSCFRSVYAPAINTVIRQFRLSHGISQGHTSRLLPTRETLGPRALSSALLDHIPGTTDIWLHQPDCVSDGFCDAFRLYGLTRHNLVSTFEPRITIIPRYPFLDGSNWSNNARRLFGHSEEITAHLRHITHSKHISTEDHDWLLRAFTVLHDQSELIDAWAQACSLRALIALHSSDLAHLTWDVGLFLPSQEDMSQRFANHSLPAYINECVMGRSGLNCAPAPVPHPSHYGAMLLIHPVFSQAHLQMIVLLQGYPLPLIGHPYIGTALALSTSFYRMRRRLIRAVKALTRVTARTLSHTGIRVLTELDEPADSFQDMQLAMDYGDLDFANWLELPHPLGVEITLPVGAVMPIHTTREVERNVYTGAYVPASMRDTQNTGLAWIAEAVEHWLRNRDFLTISRAFSCDSSSFKVKLILLDSYRGVSGCARLLRRITGPYTSAERHRFADTPSIRTGSGLQFPTIDGSLFWPTLFPITDQHISYLGNTPALKRAIRTRHTASITWASDAAFYPVPLPAPYPYLELDVLDSQFCTLSCRLNA